VLKKQLADLKSAPASSVAGKTPGDANKKLALAEAQIATLQSDKELLRLEKTALENRLKQVTSSGSSPTPVVAAPETNVSKATMVYSAPEDALRIKNLEAERDQLQKRVNDLVKQGSGRKSKNATGAHVVDLESQLAALRARLEAYEAKQVPYTS